MNHSPNRPLRLVLDVDRHIDAAFEELIHAPWGCEVAGSIWQPAIDIYELNDAYVVEADLPGVLPERVEIAAVGRRLTLSGTRDTVTTGLSGSQFGQVTSLWHTWHTLIFLIGSR